MFFVKWSQDSFCTFSPATQFSIQKAQVLGRYFISLLASPYTIIIELTFNKRILCAKHCLRCLHVYYILWSSQWHPHSGRQKFKQTIVIWNPGELALKLILLPTYTHWLQNGMTSNGSSSSAWNSIPFDFQPEGAPYSQKSQGCDFMMMAKPLWRKNWGLVPRIWQRIERKQGKYICRVSLRLKEWGGKARLLRRGCVWANRQGGGLLTTRDSLFLSPGTVQSNRHSQPLASWAAGWKEISLIP